MRPRERAQYRLERGVPGARLDRLSALGDRLQQRQVKFTFTTDRVMIGENFVTREDPEITPAKTIDASPNAPLLIRLVRYPFSLEAVRSQRSPGREARQSWGRIVEPRPNAVAWMRELRGAIFRGNPMRNITHGPTYRSSPMAYGKEGDE